jgi:proline dehydrogenase
MVSGLKRHVLYGLATNGWFESLVRFNYLTRDLAYRAASRYVAGRTLDEALMTVHRLVEAGLGVSLDLFGDGQRRQRGIWRLRCLACLVR